MTDWRVYIDFERPPTRAVHRWDAVVEGLHQTEAVAQAAAWLQHQEAMRLRVLSVNIERSDGLPEEGEGGG